MRKFTSTQLAMARDTRRATAHWAPHTMLALASAASLSLWLLMGTAGRLLLG